MEIKQCWQKNKDLNAFTIPIRVINPVTRHSTITYCIFDTGFTGYLGLTSKTIEELKLEKVGEGKAATITGDINFTNYTSEIEPLDAMNLTLFHFSNTDTNPNSIEGNNLIPIQIFRLPLIGIRAIEQLNWMILASKQILCILM